MENQELAQAAYEAHLAAAEALSAEGVLEFRVDPAVAIVNINQAMKLVERRGAEIAQHLPQIGLDELRELPSLALAVMWSAVRVQNAVSGEVSASEMISEGWKIRGILMSVVAGLAGLGAIPQAVYENIARGRGARDMAADCVALSQVFRDHQAEIRDKHGVEPELIARSEQVGSWLLANLRTRTAPQAPSNNHPEVDIRDRMATLLVERYRKLRAAAYYFYYEDYAEHAPPLNSRRVLKKRPDDINDSEPPASGGSGSSEPAPK